MIVIYNGREKRRERETATKIASERPFEAEKKSSSVGKTTLMTLFVVV